MVTVRVDVYWASWATLCSDWSKAITWPMTSSFTSTLCDLGETFRSRPGSCGDLGSLHSLARRSLARVHWTRSTRTEVHFPVQGWSHGVSRVPCVLVLFTKTVIIDQGQPRGLVYRWLLRVPPIAWRVQGAWHELGQPITEVHFTVGLVQVGYFTVGFITCTMRARPFYHDGGRSTPPHTMAKFIIGCCAIESVPPIAWRVQGAWHELGRRLDVAS